MNFKEFCDSAAEIDEQIIETNNTFVISFSKPGGTAFSIDPEDIVLFLKFLSENHNECIESIEDEPRFSKPKTYLNYQEKPYRALYKLALKDSALKTIGSLGGSQTKELTKVISKLITYVANETYSRIEDNTHFDKDTVDLALSKMPKNLTALASSSKPEENIYNLKDMFVQWMKDKGLSGSSIKKYSGSSINSADKALVAFDRINRPIYEISNTDLIKLAIDWLKDNSYWKDLNEKGNNMFQAGLNNYLEFLNDFKVLKKTILPKPFILLAGISGTGKTRFVREQAIAFSEDKENYCLVSVRPDWHEPSDLLGYITRFSGKPEYVSTKVLDFIIRAWFVAAPDANESGSGDLDFNTIPYWLCLDEMNLAPVEQYFADYLSVLETRKFENNEYFCETLLDKNLLQDLSSKADDLQADLGLTGRDNLWQYFLNHGISLPPNLIVAGTVNMDETTHGFSRKVIDRAFTFDFGEFFPNDYDSFFEPETKPKIFTYPLLSHVEQDDLTDTIDSDGAKSIAFLASVNSVLKQTPFELAYRALNELLLQVACFKPETEAQLQAVWDDFLMSKLLPRIDGDEDKLRIKQDDDVINLLDVLSGMLKDQLNEIWDGTRLDYYREMQDGSEVDGITCRTKAKLLWMKNRLEVNTFTSFWP